MNPFEKVSNFDNTRYRKCHLWAKIEASFFLGWNLVRYVVLILQECNKLTRCNGPGSELAPLLSGCVSRSDLTQSFARGPGGTEISRRSASVPTRCHPQPDWEINDEPHETVCQVWPITHFFLFPFCEKSLICLEGKSMTTHRGNTILFRSSQQLPRLRLGPWRAFWADTAPFKGPRLTSCVASGTTEIQRHRQVWRARRGGPRTPSTTTDANLDCAFVENALFYTDLWLWKVNII